MRFGKAIVIVYVIFFVSSFVKIHAQDTKFPQKNSLSKDKSSLLKEGETVIAEVKFAGLNSNFEDYGDDRETPVYERDFLKVLRENRAMISADEKFNSRKIEEVIKLLKEWLTAKGYLKAEVAALGEKLPKNRMRLIFSVKRGVTVRVSEVRFAGNRNVANDELVEDLKQCSGDDWEIFEKRKYEYYVQKCARQFFFSKGYFQARIKQVNARLIDDNYVVTIEVEEGIRYRIGEVKIEGATVFTKKELLEMSELKTGEVVDGKILQEFFNDKLKKIYTDKGYVLFDAEFEPKFIEPQAKGLDATVDISITIDEGLLYNLASISFSGIEKKKVGELRELFFLKDGEAYNQSKIEDGIKKINEMKKFQLVDSDQDVEIGTDEESNDIYLVIKVKEVN